MAPFPSLRNALVGLVLAAVVVVPRTAAAVSRTCGADAAANTTSVLCASPSGPCTPTSVTMSSNIEVTSGACDFDLGGRTLTITKTFQMIGSGYINVTNAGNVVITDTGKLKARGDFVEPNGFIISGGVIAIASSGTISDAGVIDVSGDSAGTVRLAAVGDITLLAGSSIVGTGDTLADEGERYADGGTFDARSSAGSITINGAINLPGNNQATGGTVFVRAARNVALNAAIDGTGGGGDGGEVEIDAADDVTITKSIDVSSRGGGGYGGAITLGAGLDGLGGAIAGGSLTVQDATLKLAASDADTFTGDGGDLEATAQGHVLFTGSAVAIRADAGSAYSGDGGTVYIASIDNDFFRETALDGDLDLGGVISLRSSGGGGSGGTVELSAGRNMHLSGTIDVSGKQSGGEIDGDAGGDIRIDGVLTAVATDTAGDPGAVDFAAGNAAVGTLTVAANILASGGDTNAGGDLVSLAGCGLSIEAGVKVDAHSGTSTVGTPGGSDIDLVARTPMQLKTGAQLLAYPAGHISTVHPPGQAPVIAGGVVFNPGRVDKATTLAGYPNCPVCGDGVVQAGEGCDDGNLSAGDGCAPSCTPEAGYTCVDSPSACSPTCGDGVVIAPEQCDDGNLTSNDGCGPTCTTDVGWTCTGAPSTCTQTCGDGITAPGEECDDGNLVSGDGCDANCRFTGCGNGIVTVGEACDDGNTANGDCCSSLCQLDVPGTACTSDGNVCTDDVCNATGTCVHGANTAPCADDGNVCTNDVCSGGTCTHPPNTAPCANDGNVCTNDVCSGGTCTHPPNTAPCSDGNLCTQTDTCSNGVCVGSNPIVCTASDQCHLAGTCAPATGICSNPAKANGSTCNDGNACTRTDSCQAGTCTGANPVVCTASDQCHVAGTCAPATGACSNPTKADGSTCSDGNACTRTDTCQSGTCSGGNPVVCTPLDQCHAAGTCSTTTGACSTPVLTGVACNDGNPCTRSDVCTNGTCGGDPHVCNDGVLQPTCGEQCDDGNTTSGDGCDANCTQTACGNGIVTLGEACDDGDLADGDGCSASCAVEPGWTCSGSPLSHCSEVCGDGIQTPGEECDDGNTASRDGCSSTCRREVCAATPATGCRVPVGIGKSLLAVKEKTTNDKDVLSWKWTNGQATPASAYGHPDINVDYAVCLYDEVGGAPKLKMSVDARRAGVCKGRPCWRALSSGYKYSNSALFPDGKLKILLKQGFVDGTAKIVVKGKGSYLQAPPLPLSQQSRVRLQIRNSAGSCWEATFSTNQLNLATDFKAKSD